MRNSSRLFELLGLSTVGAFCPGSAIVDLLCHDSVCFSAGAITGIPPVGADANERRELRIRITYTATPRKSMGLQSILIIEEIVPRAIEGLLV